MMSFAACVIAGAVTAESPDSALSPAVLADESVPAVSPSPASEGPAAPAPSPGPEVPVESEAGASPSNAAEAEVDEVAGEAAAAANGTAHAENPAGNDVPGVSPAAPAEEGRAIRIAVYDLDLSGVDERVGRIVMTSLLAELRKLSRASVMGMSEIRTMLDLEAQKQAAGCSADESCLAEIADALGADVIVIGTLARVGDEHLFGLRRIDEKSASVAAGIHKRMQAKDGEEFLVAIGPAIEELFPERDLRPGTVRGVTREQVLRLNPPPLAPSFFWWSAAGAGAAASLALVSAGSGVLLWSDYRALVERSKSEEVNGGDLVTRQTAATVSYGAAAVLGVVGATAAAVAGMSVPFVDWDNLREDQSGDRPE